VKILTYQEIPKKEDLLPLMDQAFNWAFHPRKFENTIKKDPRLKKTPIGYAAVENDHVVGFVGVMDLTTRNLEGEVEPAGGIWGVATLPSHVRRGISKALMENAHQYFYEKDYRFAFLCTSRVIVAYYLYRKLGYTDASQCPNAYKLICKEKPRTRQVKTEKKKIDWNKLLEIYNKSSMGKTGFAIRDKKYVEAIKRRWRPRSKNLILLENGYIIFKENRGVIDVLEITATSTKTTKQLLRLVEGKAKIAVRDRMVLNNKILKTYQTEGYNVYEKSHDLIMVKALKNITFQKVYGNKFYMTSLDLF